ncbi:MAG TPA: aldo/keto reductase, partial [Elusimicrobiota bacterium]|nr:aldo/keto reductase [Elusimicrobiota bacterium]
DEGSLTGAFTENTVFEDGDFRGDYFKGRLREVVARIDRLRPLLAESAPDMATAALKFCLSHPAVSTVIPGMRKPPHVEANVRASDLPPFSSDLLEKLKAHSWPRNFYR